MRRGQVAGWGDSEMSGAVLGLVDWMDGGVVRLELVAEVGMVDQGGPDRDGHHGWGAA